MIGTGFCHAGKNNATVKFEVLYLITPNEDELRVLNSEVAITTEEQLKKLLGRDCKKHLVA